MTPETKRHFSQRSRLEIIACLLTSAYDGSRKTRLIYRCNLSLSQFKKYVDFLIEGGLLKKRVEGKRVEVYYITERGKTFLKDYERIMETLIKLRL